MAIKTRVCEMFGIEHPVFLAGMGQVAYAEVCAAVSDAGGYGTLGMATESPEGIRQQMRRVRELTDKPFGVDLLAALPEQMVAAIDVIIEEGASSFIAGLGVPGPVIGKLHDAGLKVVSMCGRVEHAVRAEQAGCDMVVAKGTEAGGHTGRVAAMALIPQIVDAVDIPVLGAGSIVDGRGLAAALALGADGVWVGTRFIATTEARAAKEFKQLITERGGGDTIISRYYSGKPMRVINNPYVEEQERNAAAIQRFPEQIAKSFSEGVMGYAVEEGIDTDRTCMPAGQGIGGISEIVPARQVVETMVRDAETILSRNATLVQ